MKKPTVAFICVHNSCRSQMAEAIAKQLAGDVFDAYSAGTEIKPSINNDAIATIKAIYNIDISQSQHSKLIDALPAIDVIITMGCNVQCPTLPCKHREDWGLDDPSGKGNDAFNLTAQLIKEKIINLKERLQQPNFLTTLA